MQSSAWRQAAVLLVCKFVSLASDFSPQLPKLFFSCE